MKCEKYDKRGKLSYRKMKKCEKLGKLSYRKMKKSSIKLYKKEYEEIKPFSAVQNIGTCKVRNPT